MEKNVWAELARPFPLDEVSWKVQARSRDRKRGLAVAYVDARTILDRLDQVVGPDGWHDEYVLMADQGAGDEGSSSRLVEVKCRLTILGVTKEDVGEGDSLKAAFSDALKRAAVKFGIGRYLYRLPKLWVELGEDGSVSEKGLKELRRLLKAQTEEQLAGNED